MGRSRPRTLAAIAVAAVLGYSLLPGGVNAQDVEAKKSSQVQTIQKVATAPAAEKPEVIEDDVQDTIFLGDHRPIKMRIHLQVGDKAFLTRWESYVDSLFQDLDSDGNGELTKEEAEPIAPTSKSGGSSGAATSEPRLSSAAVKQLEAEPMSRDAFLAAMRTSFFPLVAGTSAASDRRGNDELIKALDTNGDKSLDAAELAAVRKNLLTLDANDDEIVGSSELGGTGNAPGTFVIGGQGPAFDANMTQRLLAVVPGDTAKEIARKLVELYDTGGSKDGKLSADEMNIGESFGDNDKDSDGALDLTELVAYVETSRPDLEVIARLSTSTASSSRFVLAGEDEDEDKEKSDEEKKSGDASQDDENKPRNVARMNLKDLPEDVRKAIDEARKEAEKEGKPFELPEIAKKAIEEARMKDQDDKKKDDEDEEEPASVNVTVDPSTMNQAPPRVWHLVDAKTNDASLNGMVEETKDGLVIDLGRFRLELSNGSGGGPNFSISRFEEQQFAAMDMDNNKYLDQKEAGRYASSFKLMDANNDNMIFLEEYKGFLAKQKAAAESQLIASVEDNGYQLFKLLDSNSDDKLSLREVYYAQQRLQEADANGDGMLSLSEIPHDYQLKLSMGRPGTAGVFAVAVTSGFQTGQTEKAQVGPDWFPRMDKNGDGDISRREFLGSEEDFERIDADGDGLIDSKEAEAATADK